MIQRYHTVFGYDKEGLCYVESFLNFSDAQFWTAAKMKDEDYKGVTFLIKNLYFRRAVERL